MPNFEGHEKTGRELNFEQLSTEIDGALRSYDEIGSNYPNKAALKRHAESGVPGSSISREDIAEEEEKWERQNPYGKLKAKYRPAFQRFELLKNVLDGKEEMTDKDFKESIAYVRSQFDDFVKEDQALGPTGW